MASWKLYWLSLLPFLALAVYIAATMDEPNAGEKVKLGTIDLVVTGIALIGSLVIWSFACDRLANERFTTTTSRYVSRIATFCFPPVWVLVFLTVPNRLNRSE